MLLVASCHVMVTGPPDAELLAHLEPPDERAHDDPHETCHQQDHKDEAAVHGFDATPGMGLPRRPQDRAPRSTATRHETSRAQGSDAERAATIAGYPVRMSATIAGVAAVGSGVSILLVSGTVKRWRDAHMYIAAWSQGSETTERWEPWFEDAA